MSELAESLGERTSRRLEQANQILRLFAACTRIERRRDRWVIVKTVAGRRQYTVPGNPWRVHRDLCDRGFFGSTYSTAVQNLVLWVLDQPRASLHWWEQATDQHCRLGRENGAAIVEYLRGTDYEVPNA